jgi:DNA-directed RNA polymerases I, II, and III subunit RPABC2
MEFDWADEDDYDMIGGDPDEEYLDEEYVAEQGDNEEDDNAETIEPFASEVLSDEQFNIKDVSKHNREIIVVPPNERMTTHWLTKYEVTEIISIRSQQIAIYNNCFVDTGDLTEPRDMAWLELLSRKTPLVIRRMVGERKDRDGNINQYAELWRPYEMTIPRALQEQYMRGRSAK